MKKKLIQRDICLAWIDTNPLSFDCDQETRFSVVLQGSLHKTPRAVVGFSHHSCYAGYGIVYRGENTIDENPTQIRFYSPTGAW